VKVVLLHAFPFDPAMWEPQREQLAGREVSAPSLYGRGNSMDAWAESLLGELDDEPFVAIGASMGGGCAIAMARQAPERIRAIVLTGAHAGPDAPERRPLREQTIERIRREGPSALWEGAGPPASADDLVAIVEALRDRPDDRDVVANLQVPLLVVVGDSDPMITVDAARALAASAPVGSFHLVEGAGHIPSRERPDDFNSVLGEWVETV
jgi:3-oxoadipate enol-lactonase